MVLDFFFSSIFATSFIAAPCIFLLVSHVFLTLFNGCDDFYEPKIVRVFKECWIKFNSWNEALLWINVVSKRKTIYHVRKVKKYWRKSWYLKWFYSILFRTIFLWWRYKWVERICNTIMVNTIMRIWMLVLDLNENNSKNLRL